MKLNLAAAFTFLASLWMPLHLLPWISWHNEVWTFVAVGLLVLASMTSSAEGLHQKQIGLPKAAWPILVLCFVSVVQVSTGAIGFLGDAVVINFYLALCVGALIVGVDHGLRNSHSDAGASYNNPNIEFFAMVVLLGGLVPPLLRSRKYLTCGRTQNGLCACPRGHDLAAIWRSRINWLP